MFKGYDIIDYKVIEGSYPLELENNIRNYLTSQEEFWVPMGGLSVIQYEESDDRYWNYAQVIVRLQSWPT